MAALIPVGILFFARKNKRKREEAEEAEEAKRERRIFRATKGLITWNDWPRTIEGRAAAAAAKRAAQRAAMIALDAANAARVAALAAEKAAEEAAKKDAVEVADIIATEKVMSVDEQFAAALAAAEGKGEVIYLT
jgi:hypothetical protein